jgi:hypothetical protein
MQCVCGAGGDGDVPRDRALHHAHDARATRFVPTTSIASVNAADVAPALLISNPHCQGHDRHEVASGARE